MMEHPEQLNVSQAAGVLGVSTRTVYRWLRQGRLTAVTRPDGRRAICRDDVTAMARHAVRQDSDTSWLHHELYQQRALLEQMQHQLDWQAELLEALVHLSPTSSLEALVRKRDTIEQLNRLRDDRPGIL